MNAQFRTQVEALRPYLLRYASMELRSREAAEDCVQEALLAALSAESSFEARSNLRTWLTGILKHKIVDAIRRHGRERPLEGPEEDFADLDALFDHTGHWVDRPQPWDDPDGALHQKQFLAALEACLAGCAPRASRRPAATRGGRGNARRAARSRHGLECGLRRARTSLLALQARADDAVARAGGDVDPGVGLVVLLRRTGARAVRGLAVVLAGRARPTGGA